MIPRSVRVGLAILVAASGICGFLAPGLPVRAAGEQPRGLIYRCRLVATDRGDDITLSFRLRTNEPRGEWRIRMFHERERVFFKVRSTDAGGDLKVRRTVPDAPRRHDVVARARHLATGAVCEVVSRV